MKTSPLFSSISITVLIGFMLSSVFIAMAHFDGPLTYNASIYQDEGFQFEILQNDIEHQITIRVILSEYELSEKVVGNTRYSTITVPEAGLTINDGFPLLPFIGQTFQISKTKTPQITVRVLESHTIELPFPILPAQFDQEIEDIERIDSINQSIYYQGVEYPNRDITTENPVILRDVRLLPVAYYPVKYLSASQKLTIIDMADIVITYCEEKQVTIQNQPGFYSPSWEMLYKALIPNYQDPWPKDAERNIPERYLLIMPDAFESRFQGFIAWKEQQGFIVDILRLSEIGSSPTYSQVKQAISNRYYSENKPVYVSVVGSTNNFPIHESHDNYMNGDFDDDLYYSQLEGDDLFPDIFLSRYPATDPDEATIMLSRILRYEQQPNMTNLNYYKTALMACSGLYESQQTTKEQTAGRLTTNLDYETIHTMYDWTSSSVAQVQNWINEGVSIINYRGEGWQAGWHPEHAYDFEYPEVYALNNGSCFPVITSIGCGVAMFDGYSECFGHAWVTLGTPTSPKGAVAFMGPTWNTRTTINNWIDRGIYRGFCYHDITRSSPAYNYGKLYAYNHFIGTQYMTNDIPTHLREYVLFGNPDLWWRTDIPRSATVYHAWPPDSSNYGIVVIDDNGKKVSNAQVSFLKDNERRVYITDSGGGCKVFMDDVTDPISYTLTGWNLLPCSGFWTIPETAGSDGDLVITEIKPDIETTGNAGDLVEIANLEQELAVNLKLWTIGDLDGYDLPFVTEDALLGPHKIAVIEFVGPEGEDTITEMDYGLYITSRAIIGLSSLEDTAVLRNTDGRVRDAVCWHNGTGIGSTNETYDLSKLTLPSSSVRMGFRGWWTGSDEVTREEYESLTVDWSDFAGNGGPGSIQRIGIPGSGVYDSPDYFTVSADTNFGIYTFPADLIQ
ncbi:hypothetical protein JW979_15440 [bacterium]|nr:hypothetical protein [candidate division CSSED10-310 bacterium]